jgi:hypothetical protein
MKTQLIGPTYRPVQLRCILNSTADSTIHSLSHRTIGRKIKNCVHVAVVRNNVEAEIKKIIKKSKIVKNEKRSKIVTSMQIGLATF